MKSYLVLLCFILYVVFDTVALDVNHDEIQSSLDTIYGQDSTKINKKKRKSSVKKKGISFGPLPVVAYDADKSFQYGALLIIYDFGDGS